MIKNNAQNYGWVFILLHWTVALGVIGLFGVGLWMDGLDYDHTWYKLAPHYHKSFGVCVVALMLLRLVWRTTTGVPNALDSHSNIERVMAKIAHWLLYAGVILMFPTGYLITTAKGQGLDVFGLFSIPATITGIDNLENLAGDIHELMAFSIITIAALHAVAALKHHFFDRDATLKRMLSVHAK